MPVNLFVSSSAQAGSEEVLFPWQVFDQRADRLVPSERRPESLSGASRRSSLKGMVSSRSSTEAKEARVSLKPQGGEIKSPGQRPG